MPEVGNGNCTAVAEVPQGDPKRGGCRGEAVSDGPALVAAIGIKRCG